MQRYEQYIANVYHDHVVLTFRDPTCPAPRVLVLDIRQAVAECDTLSAAIQLAKRRSPFDEAAPTAEIKPPVVSLDQSGVLVQKGPEGAVAALLAESVADQAAGQAVVSRLVEVALDPKNAVAEPFPLEAAK